MTSTEQLLRKSYISNFDQKERDYFVYLPRGYEEASDKTWPVMMFLHGNGERGDGKGELDYALIHGPLYEAWIQKRDLPFIIISPQLHMFDFDQQGLDYIDNRSREWIPRRLDEGIPPRAAFDATSGSINGVPGEEDMASQEPLLPQGWEKVEDDLMTILAKVKSTFRSDSTRTYLTGLSYGGFGAWYLASRYPQEFAAIAPVVGWGHPDFMPPIAQHNIPVWAFAGGRDYVVQKKYFYAGLNRLEELGHKNVMFTVHEDMAHDTWRRVYAGQDIYAWLLSHALA